MAQPTSTYLLVERQQPDAQKVVLFEGGDFESCLKEAERLLIENPDRQLQIAQTIANMYINNKPT